jgi:predicted O-methyltransferase YrrM
MIKEPFKTRLLRFAWLLSGRKPRVDQFLAGFLKYRKYLPECEASDIVPNFSGTEVCFSQAPIGNWSTPLIDVFVVIKAALGFQSQRILELGSYRGDTARLLAENTADNVAICAVDISEQHGDSYRGKDVARKITRKVGRITTDLFAENEKYDLIFVDADHDFTSVMNDTEVAFKVLAEHGVILWHDYRQDSYFHGMCGVAEALNHFSKDHAIYAVHGTWLAIFSNKPGWETAALKTKLNQKPSASVWEERQLRG